MGKLPPKLDLEALRLRFCRETEEYINANLHGPATTSIRPPIALGGLAEFPPAPDPDSSGDHIANQRRHLRLLSQEVHKEHSDGPRP